MPKTTNTANGGNAVSGKPKKKEAILCMIFIVIPIA